MKHESGSRDVNGYPVPQQDDSNLVSSILNGSVEAWHDFIERFSGLILGVIRRQLYEADEDQIRTIYVEILAALHDGSLETYRGTSSLATWLIVFTRNRARDHLRKLYGRSNEPKGFENLDARDRLAFKLFYVERLPLEALMLQMRWDEPEITADDIVRSIQRIEANLNPRYLRNLEEKHQARMRGIRSVQLARYLVDISIRDDMCIRYVRPDSETLERDINDVACSLREKIAELREDERKILYLRFEKGLSAQEIAEEMDIGGRRRVYTIIDRIVRKLRKSFVGSVLPLDVHGGRGHDDR